MRTRHLMTWTLALAALMSGGVALTAARRGEHRAVHRLREADHGDPAGFRRSPRARLRRDVKEFRIPIKDATIEIAKGVTYQGWTFGGTVPGPGPSRSRQGDLVRITVVNESPMPHSIDFHAARIPANVAYRMITAEGLGAIRVHGERRRRVHGALRHAARHHAPDAGHVPPDHRRSERRLGHEGGQGIRPRAERVLRAAGGHGKGRAPCRCRWSRTGAASRPRPPRTSSFNGRAFQYKDTPLAVDVGDRVRFFVVNAGPDVRQRLPCRRRHLRPRLSGRRIRSTCSTGVQTYGFRPAAERSSRPCSTSTRAAKGIYAFVTHSFADAEKGAVGIIQVGIPKQFARMSH